MLTDKQCWDLIKRADWKSDHDYKRTEIFFAQELSHEELQELQKFVRTKRREVAKKYEKEWLGNPGVDVSDDGWWDLTAEVVGRGEEFYTGITVEKLREMATTNDYHENFEYSFQ